MRFKTWKIWTACELRLLEQLRSEGKTAAQIAATLGRTFGSVKWRIAAEGLWKPSTDVRWLELFARPHRIGDLAQRLGVTRSAVKQAKRRLRRAGFVIGPAERAAPC